MVLPAMAAADLTRKLASRAARGSLAPDRIAAILAALDEAYPQR